MHMNPRRLVNMALLVGLLLTIFAINYTFSTSTLPGCMPPALFAPPSLFKSLPPAGICPDGFDLALIDFESSPPAAASSDGFDPAQNEFGAPSENGTPAQTSTPQVLAGTYSSVYSPAYASDEMYASASPSDEYIQDVPIQVATPTPTRSDDGQGVALAEDVQPEEDRTPTRLVIPAIKLDAPIEPVGWYMSEIRNGESVNVWAVPDHFAAGWLKTSAPVGMPGNTVLDGHHNVLGKVFKDLFRLVEGDLIILYAASNQMHVYRVEQRLLIEQSGQSLAIRKANGLYIHPTTDEQLTLITCWPPMDDTHRLIIIARPVFITPFALPAIEK